MTCHTSVKGNFKKGLDKPGELVYIMSTKVLAGNIGVWSVLDTSGFLRCFSFADRTQKGIPPAITTNNKSCV
jgi:hypothetical protein